MSLRTGASDTSKLALGTESKGSLPAWGRYLELTKPRLSFLSVVTVLVGYFAARPTVDTWLLIHLMIGTSLAAGGAAVLNQWIERGTDTGMERTRNRPLPAGEVPPAAALALGIVLCATGGLQLAFGVNPAAGFLVMLTVAVYILAYTPLKKRTHWCTEVGAVSGAIPPLVGWAGAEGSVSAGGWILFGILFFWQMPHFHAIAWLYRADYAAVRFPMLTTIDATGRRVARHMNLYGILLWVTSLAPAVTGQAGPVYAIAALALGGYFQWRIVQFGGATNRTAAARRIFFVSILYLPLLLGFLVADIWLLGGALP
jgi:heme o synthase